jgi:hypothetical protein
MCDAVVSTPMRVSFWTTLCQLVALTLTPGVAQQATRDVDAELFTYFYKDPRPERLVGFAERYQNKPAAEKWEAYPPLTGFFAVICRTYPDKFESLIPADLKPKTAVAVVAAVRLCGNESMSKRLRPKLERSGTDEPLKTALSGLPPRLDDLRVATPTHLDLLWGASFASGDTRYVAMIADFFAQTANRSEDIAIDVAETALAMIGGPKDKAGKLRGKYGDDGARQIIYAASALWALQSNAQQHVFVDRFVTKYISDHAGTPAAKALAALRPRRT